MSETTGSGCARRVRKRGSDSAVPLVSVVIPTYKAAGHLLCCVKSIVRSTRAENVEVCIYGDAGGPNSARAIVVCENLLREAGIRARAGYETINVGITAALNRAASLATGTWLLVVNDDMVFPREWLECLSPQLKPGRVLSLSCIEPPGSGRPPDGFVSERRNVSTLDFPFDWLDARSAARSAAGLTRGANYPFLCERSLFQRIGMADERYRGPYHDPDLFLRLSLAGAEMLRSRACLLYHFSGVSLRYDNGGRRDGRRHRSLAWIEEECAGRKAFIEKWGTTPSATFGTVPALRPSPAADAPGRSWIARGRVSALLALEEARFRVRRIRLRHGSIEARGN